MLRIGIKYADAARVGSACSILTTPLIRAEEMADSHVTHEVISRKEAKARGLKFYFTGAPCRRGHVAIRYVCCFWCTECRKADGASPENRKKKREYNKSYRVECPEKVAASNRKWLLANKQRHYETQAKWIEKNLEKVKGYRAKSRLTHREKRLEYLQRWRENNPDKVAKNRRDWADNNRDRLRFLWNRKRVRRLQADGSHTLEDIEFLYSKQRGRCAYCRVRLGTSYHRDHIIPLSCGGSNWISNIQLTCATCNLRKHTKDPIEFARQLGRLL